MLAFVAICSGLKKHNKKLGLAELPPEYCVQISNLKFFIPKGMNFEGAGTSLIGISGFLINS
jgi:hypothetical protein